MRGHEAFAFPANHEGIAAVRDRTGISGLLKAYIQRKAQMLGFHYQSSDDLNTDQFLETDRPGRFKYRGLLFVDDKRNYFHQRHIGGGARLTSQELSEVKGPKDCAEFIRTHSVASPYNTATLISGRDVAGPGRESEPTMVALSRL
ncbi:hypothetical protein [Piscirickettsia litoralis]|uniref:Uncharacterized protein n=1 Tax=Piscirickettsia litoralis TaxID=1891921 RepID=A0ABX2ZZ96_9GAMM|nr:hypothetical protein [Piscirickettsia litoralis]ODN41709.1 hypothetical protein BGC07_00310 [Piscirickettsia litoralis]